MTIDLTSKIINSNLGENTEIREYCTFHETNSGNNCRIYERVSIKRSSLGDNVDVNAGTYIEFAHIGNDIMIGPNCNIVGVDHQYTAQGVDRKDTFKRIEIGTGTFIGGGVIILPGRIIGERSIVGAGAIITKDIPPHSIVIGIPPNQTIRLL
jgi:UDP-2-acetamido-3-amino-2,3-dideoxy-glucuronate N-acetyltransferase